MFKHFQGQPTRTATAGVHLLIGSEPIESIIDRRRLFLFTNIFRLQGSAEYNILSRQITMASCDSHSLALVSRKALEKYNLPDVRFLLNILLKNQNGKP
ncbi:hypothetical protein DPMN_046153 [Dreissena polymorpha]|uniref:Uncharacterized protein n=1 Tax=Dreissena polymorpha TaxID=45954 RepID=A0A9D4D5F4_DREPO|nr:hypothetical protein DPMN_046153 [Dreissena polymorpha]